MTYVLNLLSINELQYLKSSVHTLSGVIQTSLGQVFRLSRTTYVLKICIQLEDVGTVVYCFRSECRAMDSNRWSVERQLI